MSDGSVASSGRTALRVAAVVLLVLVVAPFVVTGVPAVIGAEESFVVLSGSMDAEPEPIIKPGDVVIVDGVNPANVEEQDVITFTAGGEEPVTHRVVNVTQQDGQVAFRTKGDANEDADPQLVGPDQVIGEVMLVIPLIGHVVNFANTTQGFVLLVLLPIGLLVLSEAWNLVMSPDESSQEEEFGGPAEPGPARVGTAPAAGATTGTGAGVDADASGEESEDGPSTVTLQKIQTKWITVGLVPVAAAAGYLAFRLQGAWILTVFFASVGLTLLSGLVYLRMKWGAPEPEAPPGSTPSAGRPTEAIVRRPDTGADHEGQTPSTAATAVQPVVEDGIRRNPVVTGRIEESLENGSRVEVSVDSREELVRMAIEKGTWVVHDTDQGVYVLVDDGMLFRCDEGGRIAATRDGRAADAGAHRGGDTPVQPDSEWEEASDWVTFPENGEGGASGEKSGSSPDDGDETGTEDRGTAAETVDEPTESGDKGPGGTGDADVRPSREPTPVDVGNAPSPEANRDASASPWRDEDLALAIKRVDETEASSGEAATDPTRSEGADGATDGSVRTDGGSNDGLSPIIRGIGRVFDIPIRVLGFVGYLTVEPPMALYRFLRSGEGKNDESRPRSDGHTEEDS